MDEHPHFPDENSSHGGYFYPAGMPEFDRTTRDWLFNRLGLDDTALRHARARAQLHGSTLEEELLTLGSITETALYQGMADYLEIPFIEEIPFDQIADREDLDLLLVAPRLLRLQPTNALTVSAIAPALTGLEALYGRLLESGEIRMRLVVTTPAALRRAVWKKGEARRLASARIGLFETTPLHSARLTLTGGQGFQLGALSAAALALALRWPDVVGALLHLLLALVFLGTVCMRLVSLPFLRLPLREEKPDMLASPLPVYTVLIALYRESAVIPQLLKAIKRLDWPASRLDIKLVCEADDAETAATLARYPLPAHVEVVLVPTSLPRTKPKALNYALAGARGEFVTIYDAEDRPHPLQLREAHARFMKGDTTLGCLQSPLIVSNAGESWISTLFALEYAALFRCFLPMLGARRLPMPLGGTSNHFRRSTLLQAGGWDPFNVTEDADLGVRLNRLGYRTETLSFPTLEEGPSLGHVWFAQRSRWFKGWLQTMLVCMRKPGQIVRQLSFRGLVVFLLTSTGMLLSSLFHPLLILLIVNTVIRTLDGALPPLLSREGILLCVDIFNLVASYGYFILAGLMVMHPSEKHFPAWHVAMVPIYWMMLSLAAWRAILELYRKPFHWNKTPHKPVSERPQGRRKGRRQGKNWSG